MSAFYIPYAPQDDTDENASVDGLYKPTVASVIHTIATAYTTVLPGLPYPELPTIAVHNASPLFINTLLKHLPDNVLTSPLFPSDITTLTAGMKNLISGFLDDTTRPTNSRLAAYDIDLLEDVDDPLVVILHDFEQIDVAIMQDMLHICSTKPLSLIFLIFLNSPSTTPSFIHTTYSRNTLCRLRIQSFSSLPFDSNRLLEHLLLKTFFNPAFTPDLVLGPTVLESIIDFFLRHHSSVDTLLTTLQLAYLKHFLIEPLSILNNPPTTLTNDSILSLLSSRLNLPVDPTVLLSHLHQHHSTFFHNYQNFRLGLTLLFEVYTFLIKKGYKPLRHWENQGGRTKVIVNALRGYVDRDIKTLSMYVRKLRQEPFRELVLLLNAVFASLPGEMRKSQKEAMKFVDLEEGDEFGDGLMQYLMDLLQPLDRSPLWDIWYTGSTPFPTELLNPSIRASIVNGLLHPYEFTIPIPINTMNTIINEDQDQDQDGTLSPTVSEIQTRLESTHVVATSITSSSSPNKSKIILEEHTTMKKSIHELPDTSILFNRYMNGAGKLINVYDWYQSFKSVLEIQRKEQEEEEEEQQSKRRVEEEVRGKKKGKAKRKAKTSPTKKGKTKEKTQLEDNEHETQQKRQQSTTIIDNNEAYQQEIQARFIRSLHELDYLGFLKHTGRRKEHVVRTVFDVVDDDDDDEEEGMVGMGMVGGEDGDGMSGDDFDEFGEESEFDGVGEGEGEEE
ncbi:hypothetical protein Agabi119p4_9103 [Agaricus bisporus var. burnettii]|uniref:Origin recognition complex subunit 3 winged helix C-terminal domain-containing protein n=1 Tax=Agaricus bisporus var. burnettii TaxID=192524 RepID=A0A8H7C5U8_AGABI|nr:hypothetical protein Agabi119p4_9103 [Agaricus bisporus var. burnettii]